MMRDRIVRLIGIFAEPEIRILDPLHMGVGLARRIEMEIGVGMPGEEIARIAPKEIQVGVAGRLRNVDEMSSGIQPICGSKNSAMTCACRPSRQGDRAVRRLARALKHCPTSSRAGILLARQAAVKTSENPPQSVRSRWQHAAEFQAVTGG